jgi:hexosaminidase
MYARLAIESQRLEYYGLQHESFTNIMLQRMTGEADPEAMKVLASVVQPPEGYEREDLKDYDTSSALNRLVDAVSPESETGRQFYELAKVIAAGKATPLQLQQVREWLVLWRDNDAKLQPTLRGSELTAELAPVSQTLSRVATIGLQALDDLEAHRTEDASALQNTIETLKAAEKPQAVLRDMVVPSVELLVQATGK